MNEESKPSSEWEQRKSVYVRQTGKEKVYNTAEDYCPELYIIFIFIMYVNIVKCLKGIYADMYKEIKDHIYIINHKYHNIYTYYKRKYYK